MNTHSFLHPFVPILRASLATMLLAFLALPTSPAPIARAATTRLDDQWGKMPLYFIANQGQLDARVAYYVQGSDKTLYFTPDGVTFALTDGRQTANDEGRRTDERRRTKDKGLADHWAGDDSTSQRWILKLDFVDANPVRPIGQARTDAIISYFKGPREEWRAGLPTYAQIVYRDLWEGIDLAYSGTVNRLKYEFIVQPGADPARIRLAYRGAMARVNETGQLEVSTPAGGFHDDAPMAYQEVDGQRVAVAVEYALEDGATYGFHLGAYNPALPLVIDPAVLVYCGYVGGSGWEDGDGIAVDTAGNAYIVGDTPSTQATFPETVGPDLTHNGGDDVFVAKVKADGSGLVYAGYIGGSGNEYGWGIAVDAAGNAYIGGETNSTHATFPVTVGPDLTHNGFYDAFVAKVNVDGTALVYCGYIGGNSNDWGHQIAVDGSGNAYLVGTTYSTATTFPVTIGPDLTHNGDADAFVAKVNATGTALIYAGYIGGSGWEEAWDVAVDAAGNAYVGGETTSTEATFPEIIGPDLTHNGGIDVFVAKVKADGSGLVYCGYIGGSGDENGGGIALNAAGNAYVTGETPSTQSTFPVTVGPDLTHNGGYDAFVAQVRVDGTGFVYSGYIGGSSDDYGFHVAVDGLGNAYVVGGTYSSEATFPVTGGPDSTHNGDEDAFVAKVKADGTGLVYAGYIGGSGWEEAWDVAVDAVGNCYIVGSTNSTQATFPVKAGPGLTYNGGSTDAFVAKVSSLSLYLPLILR
jgi:hypothetical protein